MNKVNDIKKYIKPISNLKNEPKLAFNVSRNDIEKLNYSLESKLRQNRNEMICSYLEIINDNSNYKCKTYSLKK